MSTPCPEFLFINCTTKLGLQAELQPSPRNVRQHVMRDHFRRKKRLTERKELPSKQRHRRDSGSWEIPFLVSRQSSNGSDICSPQFVDQTSSQTSPLSDSERQICASPKSLQCHRFDPFASLAVNSDCVDSIAWWHFKVPFPQPTHTDLKLASGIEQVFKNRMADYWHMSRDEPGSFHTLVCLSEYKKATITGHNRDNVLYLHHKGEVLKAIDTELKSPAPAQSEKLILLMFSLATLTLGDDGLEASQVHINAIVKLVAANSDLVRFKDSVFQFITRNDLWHAFIACRKPILPFCRRQPHVEPAATIIAKADYLAIRTTKLLPPSHFDHVTIYALIHKLHQLSLLCELASPTPSDIRALGAVMYWSEHHLSTMIAEQAASRVTTAGERSFNAFFVMLLTCQLSAWSCMRFSFHVWQSASQSSLLQRLCRALISSADLIEDWKRYGRLESLLWTLFIARITLRNLSMTHQASALKGFGHDPAALTKYFLITAMTKVVAELNVSNVIEFRRAVRLFPCTEHCSATCFDQAWVEILEERNLEAVV